MAAKQPPDVYHRELMKWAADEIDRLTPKPSTSERRERKVKPPRDTDPKTYGGDWIETDCYCPNCGKRDMWYREGTGGDYYHGSDYECHSCGGTICCVSEVDRKEPIDI